jgi:arabinose-5-phosphate isomerase
MSIQSSNAAEALDPVLDELDIAKDVILAASSALDQLSISLDRSLIVAADIILGCKGRIVFCGIGKSGIAARKMAATFASLGTPSLFLHAADALHGDLGKIVSGDVLVAISISGETSEIVVVAGSAKTQLIPVIAISSVGTSSLVAESILALMLPQVDEGSPDGSAPMASTIMTLALGDALATVTALRRNYSREHLALLHPGGNIGLRLRSVSRLMHGGDRVPLVSQQASLAEILAVIAEKGFGITGVTDPSNGRLVGVITDGDLRRQFGLVEGKLAADIMSDHPVTLLANAETGEALSIARVNRISAIFVVEEMSGKPVGLVHLHDLLRLGVA